jgi:hypothetical protein
MVAHQLASVYEVVSMARVEDGREMRSALIETGFAPLGQAAPDGNLIGLKGTSCPWTMIIGHRGNASQGEASSCRERAKPTSIMS